MAIGTFELVTAVVCTVLTYWALKWWKNPLRKIPGPEGLPILGNLLSIKPERMHMQFFEMASKYGDVMKIYLFHNPVVILNSTEACLEALIKRGGDFQGRIPAPRAKFVVGKDFAQMGYEDPLYPTMRKVATKALKAYGPGVAHLEKIIQETIIDVVDSIHEQEGQLIDTNKLAAGYVGCVIATLMFGEKHNYDDQTCQFLHEMNSDFIDAVDLQDEGAILDMFPVLFNFPFLFRSTHQKLKKVMKVSDEFFLPKIHEATRTFDKNEMRGCLDYFIEAQREEVDADGQPILDDECLKGLLADFLMGGTETSLSTLNQIFLDLLHDPELQKKLQDEIDTKIEPSQNITLKDREKLPLMEAFLHEVLRYLSQNPFLLPHMTITDTEVAGYKIPRGTRVLMNAFHTAHNLDVYDEPFKVKPERFLDEDGNVVPPGHPARYNSIGFGAGRRNCIGELLAKSRIFLFLANILQKYRLEPAGELPDRDVRNYKMRILIMPPPVSARFIRRQQ